MQPSSIEMQSSKTFYGVLSRYHDVDGMVTFNQILEKNSLCLLFEESRHLKRDRKGEGVRREGGKVTSIESWEWEIVWKLYQLKSGEEREASTCPREEDAREGNEGCFHIRAITQQSC